MMNGRRCWMTLTGVVVAITLMGGCQRGEQGTVGEPAATSTARGHATVAATVPATVPATHSLVAAARGQIGVTTSYDAAYRVIAYPGGDVPANTGVCSDVVIRALRQQNIDLQKSMHEDMAGHFDVYPKKWGLPRPDKNIDHRRVLNLMTYFKRKGDEVPIARNPGAFAAGDIVAWDLGGGVTHIGIVSDRKSAGGVPLIVHNMGRGTREEDILFGYEIIGHYRLGSATTRGGT